MDTALLSLVVVLAVGAAAPLLSDLLPGRIRIPQVVLLLVGGILVGPQLLGWARPADLELFSTAGMAFLFLLAGYELDLGLFRRQVGRRAILAWVTSFAVGLAAMFGLAALGVVGTPIVLAIALSTTALGTLVPVLKENRLLTTSVGIAVFAVGAVGELGPILAMPIFLGTDGSLVGLVLELVFIALIVAMAVIPWHRMPQRLRAIVRAREHATGQLTVRLVVLVLFALLLLSEGLGFESVLGAFAAGVVLRRWASPERSTLPEKIDAIAYSIFIPVFFVYSGLTLNVDAIVENPLPLVVFLVFLLLVRGAPLLLWFRDRPRRERFAIALFGSTSLPLLIALTEIGVQTGRMSDALQASVIGAGVVSVLLFPIAGVLLSGRRGAASADPAGEESEDIALGSEGFLEAERQVREAADAEDAGLSPGSTDPRPGTD